MIDALITGAVLALPTEAGERPWRVEKPLHGAYSPAVTKAAKVPSRWASFARCVSHRESKGSYTVRNPRSSAEGRWQFLDTQWRVNGGLHYMVAKRLRSFGMPAHVARDVRDYLKRTHIYRWPGPYQDAAFVAVVTAGGARHWTGHTCNTYM